MSVRRGNIYRGKGYSSQGLWEKLIENEKCRDEHGSGKKAEPLFHIELYHAKGANVT